GAPEAAHAEEGELAPLGVRRLQRVAVDEVGGGNGNRRRAAGQRLGRGGNAELGGVGHTPTILAPRGNGWGALSRAARPIWAASSSLLRLVGVHRAVMAREAVDVAFFRRVLEILHLAELLVDPVMHHRHLARRTLGPLVVAREVLLDVTVGALDAE